MKIAVIGCGDFLRWQMPELIASTAARVSVLFDTAPERAQRYAAQLGARVAGSSSEAITAADVDCVALFVPPWLRAGLFLEACRAGKHVLCTKPLASTVDDCARMAAGAHAAGIRSGILYGRSSDPWIAGVRALLDSGRIGRLALYRQDWIHAYPRWNAWATDPEKNGGPFMDAMIHNLNAACYLMGPDRPIRASRFFSHNLSHPHLPCADTESLVAEYEGGLAHLFITWAADLATHSTSGNDREHIDLLYLVTDQGYRLTRANREGRSWIVASKEGKSEEIACEPLAETVYDAFAEHVAGRATFPDRLATLAEAARDVKLSLRSTDGEK